MVKYVENRLSAVERIVDVGVDVESTAYILQLMGASDFPTEILKEMTLYSDLLPKAQELTYTEEERCLHFLWDVLNKLPISVVVDFAIPFRRLVAGRLFKKCGKNFIAEENVRFNFGQNIKVGSDVFLNRGVFLDAKGGIELGDFVALAEGAEVYTHSHSESEHSKRSYNKVVIGNFAKVYAGATILPGVTVGEQAIVAARALVSADVPENMVVAGIPAKVIRERKTGGRERRELDHVWLHNGVFQSQ